MVPFWLKRVLENVVPSPAGSLKVLHVASFQGNLGDSAMHDGAYRTRAEDCVESFVYTPLEVREYFHWGQKRFDAGFVEYLNTFDLAIWGGLIGFQMWRADTASGTCFDIEPELLNDIRIPVAFYGIGCDATRGVSEAAMEKCRRFLDVVYQRNFLFSLRNDGSRHLLEQALGADYVEPMSVIADGALFARPVAAWSEWLYPARKLVAISLAGDMSDRRFAPADAPLIGVSQESFVQGMAETASELLALDEGLRVVFVPHIHSDLGLIAQVLECMPDVLRRRRVSVAPYLNGGENWSEIFDIYRKASLVIGMRFHACVVALGQGVPTIAISTHHKVRGFFEDMRLLGNCMSLEGADWRDRLCARARSMLDAPDCERAFIGEQLARHRAGLKDFHAAFSAWHVGWTK